MNVRTLHGSVIVGCEIVRSARECDLGMLGYEVDSVGYGYRIRVIGIRADEQMQGFVCTWESKGTLRRRAGEVGGLLFPFVIALGHFLPFHCSPFNFTAIPCFSIPFHWISFRLFPLHFVPFVSSHFSLFHSISFLSILYHSLSF